MKSAKLKNSMRFHAISMIHCLLRAIVFVLIIIIVRAVYNKKTPSMCKSIQKAEYINPSNDYEFTLFSLQIAIIIQKFCNFAVSSLDFSILFHYRYRFFCCSISYDILMLLLHSWNKLVLITAKLIKQEIAIDFFLHRRNESDVCFSINIERFQSICCHFLKAKKI